VGDVVGIELSLELSTFSSLPLNESAQLFGFSIVSCYDFESLELLDLRHYSTVFDRSTLLTNFFSFPPRSSEETDGTFILYGNVLRDAIGTYFVDESTVPLVTLYFRILGKPDTEATIRFCDEIYVGRACPINDLQFADASVHPPTIAVRSTRNVPGIVRILPGEPTRPNPPELPANAKVYDQAPTPETSDIRFELKGPHATYAGAREVPFRFYVTSSHEFSGFMAALRFPADFLELKRVEEHLRPGVVTIDNAAGGVGLLLSDSSRRIGAEGERVHAATLYFDVKEAAAEAAEIEIAFSDFENFFNWLGISHREGLVPEALPITAEVPPVAVAHAALAIRDSQTVPGDVNLDERVDLSDAVGVLDYLFQGATLSCLEAAEFNGDGRIDIADPIAVLRHLFNDGPASPRSSTQCGG
jgi:hypothetical protein